jgi:hypothetical protein
MNFLKYFLYIDLFRKVKWKQDKRESESYENQVQQMRCSESKVEKTFNTKTKK